MKVSKRIFLDEHEVLEALQQYLSRKNVAYEIKDLYVFVNKSDGFTGVEVITD